MGYKSTALVAVNLFISVFRTVMNVYYLFCKIGNEISISWNAAKSVKECWLIFDIHIFK